MLMAALRLNIPSIFVSGGPMMPGESGGKRLTLSDCFEAAGARVSGKIDDAQLKKLKIMLALSCGSCSGMYTANSMNCA